MNKSRLTVFLAMVLALCAIAAFALAEAPSQAEILVKASEAVREKVSLTDEEWYSLSVSIRESTLEGHSGSVWEVLYSLKLSMTETLLYSVTLEQHTGGILFISAPENAYADAVRSNEGAEVMQEWVKEKGDMYYWPQEDVVEYFEKYSEGQYLMPGADDLTTEQAIDIAKTYAVKEWGMSVDYLNVLHIAANLMKTIPEPSAIWYVYFVDENIRSKHDGMVQPHCVIISNPTGEIVGGWQGSADSQG